MLKRQDHPNLTKTEKQYLGRIKTLQCRNLQIATKQKALAQLNPWLCSPVFVEASRLWKCNKPNCGITWHQLSVFKYPTIQNCHAYDGTEPPHHERIKTCAALRTIHTRTNEQALAAKQELATPTPGVGRITHWDNWKCPCEGCD